MRREPTEEEIRLHISDVRERAPELTEEQARALAVTTARVALLPSLGATYGRSRKAE